MKFKLLLPAALLFVAGCGSSTAKVSGVVTLDGNPLPTGNVAFHPVKEGPVATGSIDSSGRYALTIGANNTGIPPGDYVVVVVATRIVEPEPGSLKEPVPERLTPASYASKDTTPLKATLTPGSNSVELKLVSP